MSVEIIFWTIIAFGSGILFLIIFPHLISFWKVLAKKTSFAKLGSSSKMRLIHQVNEAVGELSANKTGAIISITNKDPLDNFRTDGIIIDSKISSSLIISLFNKHSPLHDGAIIIEGGRIKYVSTFFKISSKSLSNKYGARHRAAMGISETTDCVTIVVSEETGKITFARHGEFKNVTVANFQEELIKYLS